MESRPRLRVFVRVSWVGLYARSKAGRFCGVISYKILDQRFDFVGEGFSPSYESRTSLSPNSRISADGLLPRAGEVQRLLLVEQSGLGGGLVSLERFLPHLGGGW